MWPTRVVEIEITGEALLDLVALTKGEAAKAAIPVIAH